MLELFTNLEDVKVAWADSYILNNHEDPHAHFADKLGIERNSAKHLCYELMYYKIDFISRMMKDHMETLQEFNKLKGD